MLKHKRIRPMNKSLSKESKKLLKTWVADLDKTQAMGIPLNSNSKRQRKVYSYFANHGKINIMDISELLTIATNIKAAYGETLITAFDPTIIRVCEEYIQETTFIIAELDEVIKQRGWKIISG